MSNDQKGPTIDDIINAADLTHAFLSEQLVPAVNAKNVGITLDVLAELLMQLKQQRRKQAEGAKVAP